MFIINVCKIAIKPLITEKTLDYIDYISGKNCLPYCAELMTSPRSAPPSCICRCPWAVPAEGGKGKAPGL